MLVWGIEGANKLTRELWENKTNRVGKILTFQLPKHECITEVT